MKTLAEHLGVVDPRRPDEPVEDQFSLDMTDRDFCRGVLCSKGYRESLQRRILMDDLPSAVETMLWNRAYGPVHEKLDVETKSPSFDTLTPEQLDQLEQRALFLVSFIRRARMNEAARSEASENDAPATGRSVH